MRGPDRRLDHDTTVVANPPKLVLAATLAGCAFALGAPGASAQRVVPLPWPPTVLPRTPPLAPVTSGVLPVSPLFLHRLATRERIVVGVDDEGTPHSVRVLQRIVVNRLGDYVFVVPAPVRSVTPGPGTESTPGQRENQILWQGFSPGRRVLAAWADLRVAESAGSLPLRLRIETMVDGRPLEPGERRSGDLRVTLTVTNVTGVVVRSFTAEPEPFSLAQVLDRIRDAIHRDVFAEGLNIGLRGPATPVQQRVAAPLRVEGSLRFSPKSTAQIAGAREGVVRISGLLDGLRRTQLRLDLHGQAVSASAPKVELRVTTTGVPDSVPPRGARSWVNAVRRGALASPRGLLARAIPLELTYARKRQYDMFLASPDPTGPSSATYVYRTVATPRVSPAAGGGTDGGGSHTVGLIVLGIGLAAAVPVAAVIWAHM